MTNIDIMTIKELIEKTNKGIIKSNIELQREIIYKEEQQNLVIDSILKGITLPAFYFWKNAEGITEIIDGKQRHHSIEQFKSNEFEYKVTKNDKHGTLYKDIGPEKQKLIDETEIIVIYHSGKEDFKQLIFYRINCLAVPLKPFEVINGLYYGQFITELKLWVKKTDDYRDLRKVNCRGENELFALKILLGEKITRDGSEERKKIKLLRNDNFITSFYEKTIIKYVKFVTDIFSIDRTDSNGNLRKPMKIFAKKHNEVFFRLARKNLEYRSIWMAKKTQIKEQLDEYYNNSDWRLRTREYDDITAIINNSMNGIFLDKVRFFTTEQKNLLFDKEKLADEPLNAKCTESECGKILNKIDLEVDHILPWSKGGKTNLDNAQLLCRNCNAKKGNKKAPNKVKRLSKKTETMNKPKQFN